MRITASNVMLLLLLAIGDGTLGITKKKAFAFAFSGRSSLSTFPSRTTTNIFLNKLQRPGGAPCRFFSGTSGVSIPNTAITTSRTTAVTSTTALSSSTSSSTTTTAANDDGTKDSTMLHKFSAAMKNLDIPLLLYFALWYVGNYFYKICNKRALVAAGGAAGFPLTIASLQLAIGSLYGIFLWVAPDARARPNLTWSDLRSMLPLAFCYAATHCASTFSYSAGSVSFGEIVKAGEPVFAAILAQFFYHRKISRAKWLCLPLITSGVTLAATKELDFAWAALISGCFANMFAAVRANENKKFIEAGHDAGLKQRMGCVGNQFALTSILGFFTTIPFLILKEGNKFGEFCTLVKTTPIVKINLVASALWFYGYNELSTMTLKKTGAVTQSVANTAKRVIVIVGSALIFKESLNPLKSLGCAIGIGGVFLYSCIDQLFPPATAASDLDTVPDAGRTKTKADE